CSSTRTPRLRPGHCRRAENHRTAPDRRTSGATGRCRLDLCDGGYSSARGQEKESMPARTGEQYLRGLHAPREIWVDGARVADVVDHPALTGAAHALAAVYDLQHEAADLCLMPDPETGETIGVSHMIPRSREDLLRRHACLEKIAEFSV